jgi:hypothetical protein
MTDGHREVIRVKPTGTPGSRKHLPQHGWIRRRHQVVERRNREAVKRQHIHRGDGKFRRPGDCLEQGRPQLNDA